MNTTAVPRKVEDISCLSPTEDIIEDMRNGRMVILVDDEDRENEGDLVIPAQMATPDVINFMATHGRGLVCLAMTRTDVARLGLPPMVARNNAPLGTAFTVSIEAREGVTTGISAPDRARTVQVAIDPNSTQNDLVMPGHVFPLAAQDGGVLVRTGHTEAAVDLARMAGLRPAGVICEIMKDDGEMARLPDLIPFAQRHGMKIGSIADVIAYRLRCESHVTKTGQRPFESRFGGAWTLHTYHDNLHGREIFALTKGDITTGDTLVRVHAMNTLIDLLGEGDSSLHQAMETIGRAGAGVVIALQPVAGASESRQYGIGAQVLHHLGVRRMVVLTSTARHIGCLNGFGLEIVAQKACDGGL